MKRGIGKIGQRRYRRLKPMGAIIFFIAGFCLGTVTSTLVFHTSKNEKPNTSIAEKTPQSEENISQQPVNIQEWNLRLVNEANPLPADFTIKTKTLSNNYEFDERAYDSLVRFLEDGKSQGLKLMVCSAYRSIDKQTQLFTQEQAQYMSKGYTEKEAYDLAKTAVQLPGCSEHNLGLAVDICAEDHQTLDEAFAQTPEGKWLVKNAADYGFILRYPKDKQEITGIIYEPWHFRFVGRVAAKEMVENNMCLEEYILYLQEKK